MSALCLGLFAIVLDVSITPVAVPEMVRGLGTDLNAVVWVNSAYLLAYAVPMLFTSRLGDRYGPRPVFLCGIAVFTVAALVATSAGSVEVLIAARVLQGVGAALLTPQTLALIGHLFADGGRGRAMGVLGVGSGLAMVAGPPLGGILIEGVGWRGVFLCDCVLAASALLLGSMVLPRWRPVARPSFDTVGILLSATGLFLVVFGVQNGQEYEWGSLIGPVTIVHVIAAGFVLLAGFVLWQRKTRDPLVPPALFADRHFAAGTAITTALGFTMTGMLLPVMVYLQDAAGLSPVSAGLVMVPMALLQALLGPWAGSVSDRAGARYLVAAGLVSMAGGPLLVVGLLRAGVSVWWLLPGLVVYGLGLGLALVPVNSATMATVGPELRSIAAGVFFTARQVGAVIGSAVAGVLMQSHLTTAGPFAAEGALAKAAQSTLFPLALAMAAVVPAALFFTGPDRGETV